MTADEQGKASRFGWLQHPFTQRLAQEAKSQRHTALLTLISVCSQSQDPKVIAALGEYRKFDEVAALAEGREP